VIFGPMFYLALAGLWLTCLAAIGARSLAQFSPHELKEVCQRWKTPERLGQILGGRDRVALAAETLQVVATAVFVGAGAYWVRAEWHADGANGLLLACWLAGGAAVLLAAEIWIPWSIVRLWAAPFLYHTWTFWVSVSVLLAPLVLVARFFDAVMHRLAGRPPAEPDEESFEDDIRTIVTEGHREGLLEEDAREMIEGSR
jgi:CBS domain containing-hemolysin-like protein